MTHQSALSILFLGVLITTLLMGCKVSRLPTTTPDYRAILTQIIPKETSTASYHQTKDAQFLLQTMADATGCVSRSEDFLICPAFFQLP